MRLSLRCSLFLVLAAVTLHAGGPVYSSVCLLNDDIFAGVYLQDKGMEPESYIVRISGSSFSSRRIAVPAEISNRNIIALFAAENNLLVVMSQLSTEQGDWPQFHGYNAKTRAWKKLGESTCISFTNVIVAPKKLVFFCVQDSVVGNEAESRKEILFQEISFTDTGEYPHPVTSVAHGTLRAEIIGPMFAWKKLKVHLSKREKIFTLPE
jgi:hypothetical protein